MASQSITKPTDSLCVLGSTEINGSLAPWEDITNGALNLFGQVQLELIEFFSGDHTNPNQPHSAPNPLIPPQRQAAARDPMGHANGREGRPSGNLYSPPASSRQPPTNVGGPSSHVPSGPSTTNADVILPPARRKLKNGRLRLGHYEPQVPIAVGNESTGRVAAIPVEKTSTFKAARPRSSTLSAGVLSPQARQRLKNSVRLQLAHDDPDITIPVEQVGTDQVVHVPNRAYERFKVKLGEAEYTVVKLPHQSRPPEGLVAMYQSDAPLRPQKVARVIRSLTDQEQSILQWLSLYKVLIGWVYERHEETLNSHNLPAYLYRHQQEKLTSWLEDQIFAPRTGGPPIMGRVVKYFAQEADNNLLAPSISSYLVKEFEAEHQIDYMASNYPSEVAIQRMSASPEFQTILSFVTASLRPNSRRELKICLHGSSQSFSNQQSTVFAFSVKLKSIEILPVGRHRRAGFEVYGDAQLELIEYFSEKFPIPIYPMLQWLFSCYG
ncbi:hypothetical protein H4Q26_013068 [Puccinia striiformis f. sp. tritici PST-130]|nr:hypothetical protein H4Q26_013068 [Puccinia striiformis f. sp. tritici PST-130]